MGCNDFFYFKQEKESFSGYARNFATQYSILLLDAEVPDTGEWAVFVPFSFLILFFFTYILVVIVLSGAKKMDRESDRLIGHQ